ncbi:MAG: TadE family type IV pilus minor pilin [Microbacterium sp.]
MMRSRRRALELPVGGAHGCPSAASGGAPRDLRRRGAMARAGVVGDQRGSVTAELAVALPAVVVVVTLAVGALTCAAAQVRLQDGAADAARLVARGDEARADGVVAGAVDGATHSVARSGDLVCVTALADAQFGPVSVPLTARSCALDGGL